MDFKNCELFLTDQLCAQKDRLIENCFRNILPKTRSLIDIQIRAPVGVTLMFSYKRRVGPFWGFKILNFNIFFWGGGGVQKNEYFLGYEKL